MVARELEDVTVDRISLVTKEYTPAVPKAETQFAIFKIQTAKRLVALKKWGKEQGFFMDAEDREEYEESQKQSNKFSAEQLEKIQECIDKLS